MSSEQRQQEPFRLQTSSGTHVLDVAVAASFWSRFRGLMLAPPLAENSGLLITKCNSVHCAFMRQSIDVVYLDAEGTVLKCVPQLKPWRASASGSGRDASGQRHVRARHTLELAAGSIARLAICTGDRVLHPSLHGAVSAPAPSLAPAPATLAQRGQRGSALLEFVVVGPMLTLMGLAVIQYSTLFFAKNQLNHATFMAARAGSLGHASVDTVEQAYIKALVPLYGGGTTPVELAQAELNARLAVGTHATIELLNPTTESFVDYGNNPALMAKYGTGAKRVIPNSGQAYKGDEVGPASGQTIQDANLIKIRIMHGYKSKVPIVGSVYKAYLRAADPLDDARYTTLVNDGFIPIVTNVTLHMQSDAIEGTPISTPGNGNGGTPVNPGDPPPGDLPPRCTGIGCNPPTTPDPVDPNTPCTGADCPICPG